MNTQRRDIDDVTIWLERKYKIIVSKKSASRIWPFFVLAGQIYSSVRAMRNYQTLPEIVPITMDEMTGEEDFPGISIIVPARNEEANIPRLLASLVRQNYPQYEVIVVDDASTDNTVAKVREYADDDVRLVSIDGPLEGWTGKNYACWVGAHQARYSWLLFVDADTELASFALSSTMHFASMYNINALSLFPLQRCETFWERLLLPFAYQQYFIGMNARVNKSDGPALANGQYFFIHQNAYEQVNGHAANAGSIVDDAAFARSLKRKGIVSFACRGEGLASVRMYTSLRQIANGFGKNIYPYLDQSPLTGIQTAISTTLASAVAMLFVDAGREKSYTVFFIAILAYIAQVLSALPWFKHFGIALRYALLMPLAALTFLAIAINSLLHTIVGHSVAWKGRSYITRQQGLASWFLSHIPRRKEKEASKSVQRIVQERMLVTLPAFVLGSLLCGSVLFFYQRRHR